MTDDRDGKVLREEVYDDVFLGEKPLELGVLRIVDFHLSVCLVLRKKFVPRNRTTLEDDVHPIRLKFVDEGLELPKEVVHHRSRTHLESASSPVALVHEVDA